MGRVRRSRRRSAVSAFALVAVLISTTPAHARPGPIHISPGRGPVGASVTIAGSGFSSVTGVSFGAVGAAYTVVSDEEITAVVPHLAPTDVVHVDSPDGSTMSDTPFVVQPNIVVILTDDQRWDTLPYMPTVNSELVEHGVTFSNAFVENPLCCPSRASFLTGLDSHSNGVYANDAPYGGFSVFDDHATIATSLRGAGYDTLLAGKYLNHYGVTGGTYVPPGWSHWRVFASQAEYYDYDLSIDGTSVGSYGSAPEDYSTDVIASLADADIRSASAQDPLFLWLAPFAPHGPSTPAPRDDGSLSSIEPWRPPSYNESDMRDKPAYMQSLPSLSVDDEATLDASREDQLESLGAVDDAVGVVTQALAETGRLSDTIIVFASDNGYMWGEHRRIGKIVPYEESVRIPLVIRWDRLATPPTTNKRLVSNVDLAPTLEQAASADVLPADGRSLLPLLRRQRVTWRQHLLIEHSGPEPQPIYCADRTPSDILIHYATGEEEYYRLGPKADPFQLINKISKPKFASRIAALRTKLRTMCTPLPPGMPAF
jgi:N-acetylglucosamine-6-sulfatase